MIADEVVVKLKDIKRYKNNNKVHTDSNVDQIVKSIEQFGYLSRIGVDENYELLYGEGRFLALKKLGWEEAPVHVIKHLSEAQKKEFRILDNKISDLSFYDTEAIRNEMEWLTNNDYEGILSELMGEVNKDPFEGYSSLNDAIEEAQSEFLDKVKEDYKGKEVKTFERRNFSKGDTVSYRGVNLIFGDIPEEIKGFLFTNSKTNAKNAVIISDLALDSESGELLIWHKGGVSLEGKHVLNNCLASIILKGGPIEKRRYNNLITAIPNKETPEVPPIALFEDILQNFIKPGTKCYTDCFSSLAAAGVTTGYIVMCYFKNGTDINDTLYDMKSYLGLKEMEVKINEEVVIL